ncbi:hypothetical protein B0H11DRAFT_1998381 [Mycena galericulata]|nr:hypothetical protein B0H11DRAFT_1998381 [Mycena galericulata]
MVSQSTTATRAADRTRLAELDSGIATVERALRKLHRERKRVQLTLPNEIVSEIFTHFLPKYPHVCRKWREIALSIPTLWRAISVSLMTNRVVGRLNLLETWLEGSRSCALSICFTYDAAEVWPNRVPPLLLVLFTRCDRLEHLDLRVHRELFAWIKGPMPLLHSLRLELQSQTLTGNEALNPVPVFQDAPQLREADLGGCDVSEILLPWSQVTQFKLTAPAALSCKLLENMTNLVHCSVKITVGYSIPKHMHLPHLKTLIIVDVFSTFRMGFIALWVLPALRKLEVPEEHLRPDLDSEDPVQALVTFVARSGCNLEDVCIIGRTSAEAYRRALPSIPLLVVSRYGRVASASGKVDGDTERDMESDSDSEDSDGAVSGENVGGNGDSE